MKSYDVIVVGSGSGTRIVDSALGHGMHVALVDRGPLGGTCMMVGCIPSKKLIFPADRVMEAREAKKLGVEVDVTHIDFEGIMERMRRGVREGQEKVRAGIEAAPNLDFYEMEGHFVDEHMLQVGDQRITSDNIFLVSGARPLIPPIEGIEDVSYLTNESVLELTERPKSLLIVGGGYIGAEYGHFFAAMGTRVTIIERNDRLMSREEPEISELLTTKMSERMDVHTGAEAAKVGEDEDGIHVVCRNVRSGEEEIFNGERIMIAAGRKSNADLLQVENAGIETDERNYIKVNEYLETNVEGVWALGDATGEHMFKHVANREAAIVSNNFVHDHHAAMDYSAVPHAVFSYPQIASVGLTEAEARKESDILVGRADYWDVAKGEAMMETDGFAKAIVTREDGRILGFHIIGPYAPILIQEVITVMANEGTVRDIAQPMHIHPAMPELIPATFSNLQETR
ncbi:MAG: dihydrolipoyl dehydrogenase [Anaerolineae bacterium]